MIAFVVQAQIKPGMEELWESNWRKNAPIMKNNPGHHFRHLMRSTEDPSQYLIYGLWDSEEELRAALGKGAAQTTISAFDDITAAPAKRVVYTMVGTDEDL